MQFNLKKGFCVWMATWLLLANVGFAWSQSTCQVTGVQKNVFQLFFAKKTNPSSSQIPSVSRASCYQFRHFQVKHQASFTLEKQVIESLPISFFITQLVQLVDFNSVHACNSTVHGPRVLLATVRRAILQIYRI